ncbi:rod shape-determining protein MreC [Microvirgula aerodenitrificans]|uniref:rod shape-determining protein MreC n=1 Tax=Microvirgula aerodenitrificans TaxID=57480 RepID=UPI00048BDDB8|nr:rod shape-determining protein MreC [Microvirgula aerodenitrificans]
MDFSSQPRFFRRGTTPLTRLIACGSLSLALMVTDSRLHLLEHIRETVAVALYPLQWLVNTPIEAAVRASDFFTAQAVLERENHTLRNEQLMLSAKLQRLANLEQENRELRSLGGLKPQKQGHEQFAEILYQSRDPFTRKLIIDQGDQSGIQPGMPVIDAHGLLGQVSRVAPLTSEVTLITEKDSAVPVMVSRNGLRALLFGTGGGVEVRFLPSTAEIEANDLLVTSAIDGTYPPGLAVARVLKVEHNVGGAFARVICTPLGEVDRGRFALVLQQQPELPAPPPEPVPKPQKKKNRRAGGDE